MLKFGFRNKNFYPIMLLLFIVLRTCLDKLMKIHPYKNNIDFLLPFLIFVSQSLICFLIHLYYYKKKKRKKKEKNIINQLTTIELIINNPYLSTDSLIKIRFLIFFGSFFNFIGTIIRSDDVINFGKKEENNSSLEVRIRSIQIVISSLLCYFTIRLIIYKHQKLSLIVISFFLAILLILELCRAESLLDKFLAILICTMSCLSRSFLDVIEKYLFDFNYIEILKIVVYEGFIALFFYIIYFFCNNKYQTQAKYLVDDMSEFNWSFISFIILIIIYLIISGLRNAYRVATNKYYSPMSRALFESAIDPILYLYNNLTIKNKEEYEGFWIYFGIIFFCLIVISIFSLIYNDLIVLYCCGLEYNTYYGITNRLYSEKQTNFYDDNDSSSSDEEKDDNENKDKEKMFELTNTIKDQEEKIIY